MTATKLLPCAIHGERSLALSQPNGSPDMRLFKRSRYNWWRKPLVRILERDLPAELVILAEETSQTESGAWLNSRGTNSGVIDLEMDHTGRLKSVRTALPKFVTARLKQVYSEAGALKGIPDLVLWSKAGRYVRFVEVKCPEWDRASPEQMHVHAICRSMGCAVEIAEWRFLDGSSL